MTPWIIVMALVTYGCAAGTANLPPGSAGGARVAAVAVKASSDSAWLIGTWEGEQVGNSPYSVLYPNMVKVEFRLVGNEIRWELSNNIAYPGGRNYSEAAGLATVSGTTVILKGRYVGGRGTGTDLSYELTRNGDRLEGIGSGISPMFRASWMKVK